MSIVPIITAKQMLTLLARAGFVILRQAGSHIRLMHPITRKTTTVSLHGGDLSRPMIMTIIKQAGISVSQFLKLIRK
jgi:predicted RNA binding protein YcfA (HicA-like mRNA interferase family)